jgi:hypothetical protein
MQYNDKKTGFPGFFFALTTYTNPSLKQASFELFKNKKSRCRGINLSFGGEREYETRLSIS